MIDARPHPEGTILPIRARAGARADEIRGEQSGCLKVCVTQAPEKGKANKAIIALLAKTLDVRKSGLRLIAGEATPRKEVLVEGIAPDELQRRLRSIAKR